MKKHFAATAYIVSKIDSQVKVLLHKHKKLGIWIAIGGHIEENENPVEAVIREVEEETTLEIKLITLKRKLLKTDQVLEQILPEAIIEEKIPIYQDKPEHVHIDLVYFAFCKNPQNIKMREKYKWFSKEDLKKNKIGKEVITLGNMAIDRALDIVVN